MPILQGEFDEIVVNGRVVRMPTAPQELLDQLRDLPRAVSIGLAIFFTFVVLAVFGGFAMKVHVMITDSHAAFKACLVGYAWEYYQFSLYFFSGFFGLGLLNGLASVFCKEDRYEEEDGMGARQFLAAICFVAVLLNCFAAFAASLLVWFSAADPEGNFFSSMPNSMITISHRVRPGKIL